MKKTKRHNQKSTSCQPRAKSLLVTGGAGFIGSEFVRQGCAMGYKIAVVDKLTYAGDLSRLKEVKGRYQFYKVDICNKKKIDEIFKKEKPDAVVHFAAESHVDNSIRDPFVFEEVNIRGTLNLLACARKHKVKRFIQISTDEVYGEIEEGKFTENYPLAPNSPYSASKAAGDFFVRSYIRTFDFPAIIIRPSNNYGPWQYPEKLIPVIISKALKNQKVPVYAKGLNRREWLYVSDCAKGIYLVLRKGKVGEIYNIGSGAEKKNIDVVRMILKELNKSKDLIQFVKDRPGHDFRYSLDSSKIEKLGFKTEISFKQGIEFTLDWYCKNKNRL
ncbi:MAG: dTDP-glucose 4,6-dehydratase [Candidatus Omnitrophica bacterium]|nr:dTDP-glucose 4,6-dehydratase [Candidatus Omnitrophota bacterium]